MEKLICIGCDVNISNIACYESQKKLLTVKRME